MGAQAPGAKYAVPLDDVEGEIVDAAPAPDAGSSGPFGATGALQLGDHPVLYPNIPFSVHTAPGEPLSIRARDSKLEAAVLRPSDSALDGFVLLDFGAFDAWYEDDERNLARPRDYFSLAEEDDLAWTYHQRRARRPR